MRRSSDDPKHSLHDFIPIQAVWIGYSPVVGYQVIGRVKLFRGKDPLRIARLIADVLSSLYAFPLLVPDILLASASSNSWDAAYFEAFEEAFEAFFSLRDCLQRRAFRLHRRAFRPTHTLTDYGRPPASVALLNFFVPQVFEHSVGARSPAPYIGLLVLIFQFPLELAMGAC